MVSVFFVASKIFWMFASPIDLLLAAAFLGLLFSGGRHRRAGRLITGAALLILIALATTPIGLLLMAQLEDRFPQPPADMSPPHGVIILGGAINDWVSGARGQTVFDDGERVVEAAILARRHPEARIVFTGGSGSLTGAASTEALEARKLLTDLGIDPARITLESRSRNTDENARFTAALVQPEPSQRWLLVTSAFHMPRGMGLFEKAGFDVTAYPVAYRTLGPGNGQAWDPDPARNLRTFEIVMREWIGLALYWATGRIDHLFPGPDAGVAKVNSSPHGGSGAAPDYSADGRPRR
jgi:uncharacterized SAM-binding protein YcdF (DUF218 family)